MKQQDLTQKQFGDQAQNYLSSAVHAQGAEFEQIITLARQQQAQNILDLGCGAGHVSFYLAAACQEAQITAYDLSDKMLAVVAAEAGERGLANIKTQQGMVEKLPFADNQFDLVVTRYSAHHWLDVPKALSEIKRVLKPDGMLIISTPDKLIYSDKRNFKNEFHVKELYKDEFVALISKYFSKSQLLFQNFIGNSSVLMEEQHQRDFKVYTGNYSNTELLEVDPFYLVLIASDYDFKKQNVSLFEGSSVENYGIVSQIYNSNSYKIGHFLLTPIRVFRKIFKN